MNHKAEMSLFAQNHTLHKDALPQDFVCTTTHLHTVFYAALSQTIPACSNSNIQNVSLKTCMLSLHLDPMFLTCFHGTLGIARLYHPLKHNQKLSSFNMTSIPSNAMSPFYHHICVSVGGVHVNTVCVCVCVCLCMMRERECMHWVLINACGLVCMYMLTRFVSLLLRFICKWYQWICMLYDRVSLG